MPEGLLPRQSTLKGQPLTLESLDLRDGTAVVFENRDGALIDAWLTGEDGDDYGHIALMCYWLDEKIVRTPLPTRTALIRQRYEDAPGEAITDLVVVRRVISHAEPVAAMISRATALTNVQHVSICADMAWTDAFRDIGVLLADSPLLSMTLSVNTLDTGARPLIDKADGPVIEQLPRERFMPQIVRDRNFGNRPGPDDAFNRGRQLQ